MSTTVAVCLKWVGRRPEVDPLTGATTTDPRSSGPSEADQAALEWALRIGEQWGAAVTAVALGPALVEPMLRDALALGATSAVRVDGAIDAPSAAVAAALHPALDDADLVLCGDWSLDRGSGSVPAYLAAHRGAAQALGLVSVEASSDAGGPLAVERRLDGGRRERLSVPLPAVLSVEGNLRPRRAGIDALVAAKTAAIDVRPGPGARGHEATPAATQAYRPRARHLAAPHQEQPLERILALTGALVDRTPPEQVALEPGPAADRLLEQLRTWGYLE